MRILTKGVIFVCDECGISGEADLPKDFEKIRCNDELIYSIPCPCCSHKMEVPTARIPEHLLKRIPFKPTNIGAHHD